MDQPGVIIVLLRRPRRGEPEETRPDPFWEFGSFGCTGCHSRNLLNPRKADSLVGVRLAFAQGGPAGTKLVYLSPPIRIEHHSKLCEARWKPAKMPFRYDSAVLVVSNDGRTELPSLKNSVRRVKRHTWAGKFASAFRSRRRPLRGEIGAEVITVYEARRRAAGPRALARIYFEALPYPPPLVDPNRKRTYDCFLRGATGRQCKRPRRRRRCK